MGRTGQYLEIVNTRRVFTYAHHVVTVRAKGCNCQIGNIFIRQ